MSADYLVDISKNPFVVLGIPPSATASAIEEAYEDQLSEGFFSQRELQKAKHALVNPRSRLEPELSGFIDSDEARVAVLLDELRTGPDADADALGPLTRSNLLAHVYERTPANPAAISSLLRAQSLVMPEAIHAAINGARKNAGIVGVDRTAVDRDLQALFERQFKAVLSGLRVDAVRAAVMTEVVTGVVSEAGGAVMGRMDVLLASYGQVVESEIGRRRDRIVSTAEAAKQSPRGKHAQTELLEALSAWDDISQPIQLLENFNGRDDPGAKEVYDIVRNLAICLANEKEEHSIARTILVKCAEIFREVPRAAAHIQSDLSTLNEILAQKSMNYLRSFVENSGRNLHSLSRDISKGGFGPNARGAAKKLFDVFVNTVEATRSTELREFPWMEIRGLAITLNNDAESPYAASAVLHGLLSYGAAHGVSSDLIQKLKADVAVVARNLAHQQIEQCIKAKQYKDAIEAIDRRLAECADASERASLRAARREIKERQSRDVATTFARLAVAAIVLVVLAFWLRKPPVPSSSTPSPTLASFPQPAAPVAPTEDVPTAGDGTRALTRSNIRYCLFQQKRLDGLEPILRNNADIARYNARATDWNARCGRYRYLERDMTAVQAELSARAPELLAQGRRLLRSSP